MTSTPLIETMTSHLETQLGTISIANSYRTDVKTVTRILKSMEERATDMPLLTILHGREDMEKYTNREIKSTYTFIVIGYVVFDEFSEDASNAQQKLIKLISDVKEKLSAVFTADRFNNTTENFHVSSIETDEGLVEPYAVFRMECAVDISYKTENVGVVVGI